MDILQQRDSSGRTRCFVSIVTKKENKQERRTKSRFAYINQAGLSSSCHPSLRLYLHWVQFENTKNNDKNINNNVNDISKLNITILIKLVTLYTTWLTILWLWNKFPYVSYAPWRCCRKHGLNCSIQYARDMLFADIWDFMFILSPKL